MRRLGRIAALGLLMGACAHTKTTDEGAEKPDKSAAAKAEKARERKVAPDDARTPGGDRDKVPVTTSPRGLMAPGADEKIRERLAAEGFLADDAQRSDAATSEGIRRFQDAHDLPATGVPDHQTVKALGLDPDAIFRQGPVKD